MKLAIVINSQRHLAELKTQLESPALTEQYQIHYDLFTPEPENLASTLEKLNYQAYHAVVIGGGDGTVRTAVQVLIEKNIPLIILPLGTFNVLAKSLEYPDNIEDIFKIVKNNKTRQIDIAQVNGNVIVNHAWLGFYYYILKMRERHKNIFGKSRLLKALFNTFTMFKRLPFYHFDVKVANRVVSYKTCLLFISNNESTDTLFNFGERKSLAGGYLSVSILNCHTRWELFLCMLSIAISGLKHSKYVIHFNLEELKVSGNHPIINTVLDGEPFKLDSPLHFSMHPKKLTVLVP